MYRHLLATGASTTYNNITLEASSYPYMNEKNEIRWTLVVAKSKGILSVIQAPRGDWLADGRPLPLPSPFADYARPEEHSMAQSTRASIVFVETPMFDMSLTSGISGGLCIWYICLQTQSQLGFI
jgi:hypothetical protein